MAGKYFLDVFVAANALEKKVGQFILLKIFIMYLHLFSGNGGEIQWCFSQVKGTVEEDITEGKP